MEIASRQQLRLAFLRWAIVTVPFVVLLGFLSSRVAPMGSRSRWYVALAKPAGTPPDWVFPVAWGLLYVLMGLALAMIIHARGARLRGPAIMLFAAQLIVNLLWSPLFFGLHLVGGALVALGAIFVLALLTTLVFGRVRTAAAWLMVPYLAWLCYAGALTYGIYGLNPDAATVAPSSTNTQIQL
ncbi:TspO/MBR family protein [uncultured Sphingomonas sp.]|uniref:TspO/MBR family protein n=1 Tax=uncultured Sphingomonas sp. TaxID=158754 RepID=UPI0035CAA4A8